ncbi:hypothetical protein NE237_033293 [Protea cynaroides]|uniref:Late embryogenesis abundant protein LEA-2 subgroup domain-containing protein n=1 Tax=Protea cynaroides TaxID=273540 RepID=A0A9Q0L5Z6_9MAGN|nr:hypothetical protein NE237_033293 [Protea cynaroides]
MPTTAEIPIHTAPTNQPTKRRQKARHYVHRVRESFSTRVTKFLCSILLILLLVIGIIFFILWLSLRPHRPRVHIKSFSFPALAQDNGFDNAQITFNVSIRNPNLNMGVYYNAMVSALYFQDQRIGGTPLPLPSPSPYYQKPQTTTSIEAQLGVPSTLVITDERWKALMVARVKGTIWFRLDVTSTIQFKIATWRSKHHKMHASCQVAVGQDGIILPVSEEKRCPLYFD